MQLLTHYGLHCDLSLIQNLIAIGGSYVDYLFDKTCMQHITKAVALVSGLFGTNTVFLTVASLAESELAN